MPLAATAVPVWARSRSFLGPIFVATATAIGAALTRLVLVARGLPEGHATRVALGRVETAAIAAELTLSTVNERRLGPAGRARREGRARTLFRVAEGAAVAGLRLAGERTHAASSTLYKAGGLAFRYAWVEAGRASARDDEAVADTARGTTERREVTETREPRAASPARVWTEAVRRTSLLVERVLPGTA